MNESTGNNQKIKRRGRRRRTTREGIERIMRKGKTSIQVGGQDVRWRYAVGVVGGYCQRSMTDCQFPALPEDRRREVGEREEYVEREREGEGEEEVY